MSVKFFKNHPDATLPTRANPTDAGLDLYSVTAKTLRPGDRYLFDTGVVVQLREGQVGLIHPRSGLTAKHGITVLNAPGTIDQAFRASVKVLLINHGDKPHLVNVGDRIAQLVVQDVSLEQAEWTETIDWETDRGQGGFGSSGQ